MKKEKIVKMIVIAIIAIAVIVTISLLWKRITAGAHAGDIIVKDPATGAPIPVDMAKIRTISEEFHKQVNGFWISQDLMEQISLLNGQELSRLADYYRESYQTSFFKDIESVNMPFADYDEVIEARLKQLGKGV